MFSASIAECMSTEFAKISPEMPVAEASARLIKQAVLGGPVTSQEGKLLGWISEQECLQATLQVVYHNTRVAIVQDLMRNDVMTLRLDSDPLEIAQQMLLAKPKSYPIIDDSGKVLGVLSRRHILIMLDKKLREIGQR